VAIDKRPMEELGALHAVLHYSYYQYIQAGL
jgi:hypothetical protein